MDIRAWWWVAPPSRQWSLLSSESVKPPPQLPHRHYHHGHCHCRSTTTTTATAAPPPRSSRPPSPLPPPRLNDRGKCCGQTYLTSKTPSTACVAWHGDLRQYLQILRGWVLPSVIWETRVRQRGQVRAHVCLCVSACVCIKTSPVGQRCVL